MYRSGETGAGRLEAGRPDVRLRLRLRCKLGAVMWLVWRRLGTA